MVAVPEDTAVTVPLGPTVATASLFEDQPTPVSVALEGDTIAVSWKDSPSPITTIEGSTETPETLTTPETGTKIHRI